MSPAASEPDILGAAAARWAYSSSWAVDTDSGYKREGDVRQALAQHEVPHPPNRVAAERHVVRPVSLNTERIWATLMGVEDPNGRNQHARPRPRQKVVPLGYQDPFAALAGCARSSASVR